MKFISTVLACVCLAFATVVLAENSVVVESKTVKPGAANATVAVRLTNDVDLRQMIVPLVIREVTTYITSLTPSYGDRFPDGPGSPLSNIVFINEYPLEDGHCKQGQAGGFSTIGPADLVSPDAVLFARAKITGGEGLPAGADATGSMLLTFDAPLTQGVFEIDTTCADPANHLEFFEDIDPIPNGFAPSFTKGIITVHNDPPEAHCQNLTVDADVNCEASVVAADIDNGSFDPDGDPIDLSLNPLGPYLIGATQVWLIVSDDTGEKDSCEATITVVDNTPPDITCPSGDVTVGSDPGDCSALVVYDLDADDNCGVVSVEYTPASGSVFPVGTTPVRCIATDAADNADTCDFNVVVEDTEPPVVSCPADIVVAAEQGFCDAVVAFSAAVDDNCPGAVVVCTPPTGSVFPVGVTTVTCIGTDASGNADTCDFTVTVGDAASPWTVCNLNDSGPGSLRSAIDSANASPGADVIEFNVAGTIESLSPLPPLSDQTGGTFIDGLSAPGASSSQPFVITVTLDGSLQGSGDGLAIGSSGNHVTGLGIRRHPASGIVVSNGSSNTISRNLIYDNEGLGIDLGGDGVTPNDPGDGDGGPNDLANFPSIDTVKMVGDQVEDSFYVSGVASSPGAVVELYLSERYLGADTTEDLSHHGEAWFYIGTDTADGATGYFVFPLVRARRWSKVAATETDLLGNTSEFSLNRSLTPDPVFFTAYGGPVTITVILPGGDDSIGVSPQGQPFNTIGETAVYDAATDYGPGPDGLPGVPDDRVTITNVRKGNHQIRIRIDNSAKRGDVKFYFSIRVDGTEQAYSDGAGNTSSDAVELEIPEGETEAVFDFEPEPVARGDIDGDEFLTAVDLALYIDILFAGSPLPDPLQLADLNCDGQPDALDLAYLIDHLFAGGDPPCF
jgi:hypothetical protein